jgi:hypothetical protein
MRVASDILSADPDFNGVYDRVFIPVAPAFGTPPVSAPSAAAAGGLEVRQEVLVRLHGDDAAALRRTCSNSETSSRRLSSLLIRRRTSVYILCA